MGKKLFVGGLPYETNDAQLKEMFGTCGQVVSAKVIMDKVTGRSKGFGFVEMTTDEQAKTAMEKLNNSVVGARKIFVNEARPMEPRPAGGFAPRPSGFGGDKKPEGWFGDRAPSFGERKGGGGYDDKRGFGGKRKRGGDYDKRGDGDRDGGREGRGGRGGGKGRRDDGGYDGW